MATFQLALTRHGNFSYREQRAAFPRHVSPGTAIPSLEALPRNQGAFTPASLLRHPALQSVHCGFRGQDLEEWEPEAYDYSFVATEP